MTRALSHGPAHRNRPTRTDGARPPRTRRAGRGRAPTRDAAPTADIGWSLVRAHQGGDPAAFEELFSRYQHRVLGYVRTLVPDAGLAEDLTQDTFVRALRGIGSAHEQGRDVAAWLFTIARNLAFSHYRSSRHRREVLAEVVDERPAAGPGPDEWVCAQETRGEIAEAFEQLPPAQRECVVMRFVEERSAIDTARRTGRSPVAVASMQHRALRRLAMSLPRTEGQSLPSRVFRNGQGQVLDEVGAVRELAARPCTARPGVDELGEVA